MISVSQLGGVREDIISYLGPLLGKAKVTKAYDDAIKKIRAEAEAGARAGVNFVTPMIEKRVRAEATKAVRPIIIGSFAASGIAMALGLIAIVSVKKKRKLAGGW